MFCVTLLTIRLNKYGPGWNVHHLHAGNYSRESAETGWHIQGRSICLQHLFLFRPHQLYEVHFEHTLTCDSSALTSWLYTEADLYILYSWCTCHTGDLFICQGASLRCIFTPLTLLSDDTKPVSEISNLHLCSRPITGLSTLLMIGSDTASYRWKVDSPGDEKQLKRVEKKKWGWERARWFDEVCDGVSIKVQSRTLNNIVEVCKGQYSQGGLSILIFPLNCAGLDFSVRLNHTCLRLNKERDRDKKRQR